MIWAFALVGLMAVAFAVLVSLMSSKMEVPNGPDWQTGTPLHRSPNSLSNIGPGGAYAPGAIIPVPSPRATTAHQAALQRALAHQQLMQMAAMTHPAYMTPPMLGAGPPSSLTPSPPPHPRTTLKSEGVRAGEIIAWRGWMIRDGKLKSMTANATWEPGGTMEGDAAAGFGIHAYKSPHGPVLDGYGSRSMPSWVIGEIALWGDVIEHEEGYRAQFGRPHSFVTWSEDVPVAVREEISARYLAKAEPKLEQD